MKTDDKIKADTPIEEKGRRAFYKFNFITLAKHHKKYCVGEDCVISLSALLMCAQDAGVVFSKEEKELFL